MDIEMAEIEVGEYGRTNFGKMIKFAWLESLEGKRYENKVLLINEDMLNNDFYYFHKGEKIVKHSKQLIDLIEVGDIVNKELVIGIIDITNNKEEIIGKKLITQYRSAQFTGLDIKHYIYANDIKTILTKEQFEANCYKVGGEDE